MVWYLILCWTSLILAGIFILIKAITEDVKKKKVYDNFTGFFIVLMLFFFVIALATRDPITDAIDPFYQFIATALAGAFSIWKWYLGPLKERVIGTEKDIVLIKNDISYIKEDIKEMKQTDTDIQKDIKEMKQYMMKK